MCPTLCDPMDCSTPRLPCPSPTSRTCSDACALSWYCHPSISSSVVPFSCVGTSLSLIGTRWVLFNIKLTMCKLSWASLVAQMIKNLPAMLETWVQSLGWEDPLEKGTATNSSILAWRVPWTENSGELQSMGSQRVRHDWTTFTFALFLFYNFAFRELYYRAVYVSFSHLKMQQCLQYFIMNMTVILCAIKIF